MVSCVGYTSGDTWIGLWNHNLEYCYDGAGSPCDGVFSTMDPSRPFPVASPGPEVDSDRPDVDKISGDPQIKEKEDNYKQAGYYKEYLKR